jgi:diadenosine tetraphosphate (Ap4A) HIT family hydrolase
MNGEIMTDCIFCKIVKGEVPCTKLWEDENHLAFLDLNPNTKGMTLVITKKHFDSYAFDMPDKDYEELMLATKKVAKILEKGLKVQRVAMVMEGLGVNHVHIKMYPMHGLNEKYKTTLLPELVFFDKYPGYITTLLGPKATSEELKKVAEEIRKNAKLD